MRFQGGNEADDEDATSMMQRWTNKQRIKYLQKRPDAKKFKAGSPIRQFVELGDQLFDLTRSPIFRGVIFGTIGLAGLSVMLTTYDTMDGLLGLEIVNFVILGIFCIEVLLKILAESIHPWKFFYGNPEWKWNIFDFCVVLLSMPFLPFGNTVQVARLVRLLRVLRASDFVHDLPKLLQLLEGVLAGLDEVPYIAVMMGLINYLFAVLGVLVFGKNDPFHFQSLFRALVTLFRVSTLEDWSDVFYINYYGCAQYDAGIYTTDATDFRRDPSGWLVDPASGASEGRVLCAHSSPMPVISVMFFFVFIVVGALSILSMFIGAIAIAMSQAIGASVDKKFTAAFRRRSHIERDKIIAAAEQKVAYSLQVSAPNFVPPNEKRPSDKPESNLSSGGEGAGTGGEAASGSEGSGAGGSKGGNGGRKDSNGGRKDASKDSNGGAASRQSRQSNMLPLSATSKKQPLHLSCLDAMSGALAGLTIQEVNENRRRLALVERVFYAEADAAPDAAARAAENGRAASTETGERRGIGTMHGLSLDLDKTVPETSAFRRRYQRLAISVATVTDSSVFEFTMMGIIVVVGVVVGIASDHELFESDEYQSFAALWEPVITLTFAVELAMKVCSHGFAPSHYWFRNGRRLQPLGWNWLDTIVVMGSCLPRALGGSDRIHVAVKSIRLFRLLSLFRLFKWFPQMQVAVAALMNAAVSVGYIALLMFVY
jgi:voltage-gated sodium channel